MDFYGGIYEHPPTQASIHVLPAKNELSKSSKSKRTWANILRIPGRQRKSRDAVTEDSYSFQKAFFPPNEQPNFNLPSHEYFLHKPSVNGRVGFVNHDFGYENERKRVNGYRTLSSATSKCTRGLEANAKNGTANFDGKNTVKYTDWFGTVSKKKPLRPPLPAFHNPPNLQTDGVDPLLNVWGNYINSYSVNTVQNFLPTIVAIQNPQVCICPDQIFATKSKKRKKCKNCGRKFNTIRNKTITDSVTKIRPVLPPSFYHVPHAPLAVNNSSERHYTHPMTVVPSNHSLLTASINEVDEHSCPPTPDTVRSNSSDKSDDSLISSNTIVNTNFRTYDSTDLPVRIEPFKSEYDSHMQFDKNNIDDGLAEEHNSAFIPIISNGKTSINVTYRENSLLNKEMACPSDTAEQTPQRNNTLKKIYIENSKGEKRVYGVVRKPVERENVSGIFKDDNRVHEISRSKKPNPTINQKANPKEPFNLPSAKRNGYQKLNNLSSHNNGKEGNDISDTDRDLSNVVSIAGQQVLLNHRKEVYSFKPFTKKLNVYNEVVVSPTHTLINSVKDWDSLNDYVTSRRNVNSVSLPDTSPMQSSTYSDNGNMTERNYSQEDCYMENTNGTLLDCSDLGINNISIVNGADDVSGLEQTCFPCKNNGEEPSVTELSTVKSILKRPNSLDTGSETDSDVYFQSNGSDVQERLRKKKSVQFVQSQAKLEAIFGDKKKKDSISKVSEINVTESSYEMDTNPRNNCLEENNASIPSCPRIEKENNLLSSSLNKTEEYDGSANSLVSSEKLGVLTNTSNRVRRTHSHRESIEVKNNSFHDTYRLRQSASRPSILQKENASRMPTAEKEYKSIYRRGISPIRPSVPPPPPPASAPSSVKKSPPESISSSHSSPSPPPLPSTSPPPLPSSSPPSLHTSYSLDYQPCSDHLESSSFSVDSLNKSDDMSATRINHRTQQVFPSKSPVRSWNSDQRLHLSIRNGSGSSNVDNTDNDCSERVFVPLTSKMKRSFTLDRIFNTEPKNASLSSNDKALRPSFNTTESSQNQWKIDVEPDKSLHLNALIDEIDIDERLSDHIYEELPSLPSSPCCKIPVFQEKSIFDGASKYEILEFLQDARNRVNIAPDANDEEILNEINGLSNESLNSNHVDDQGSLVMRGNLSLQSRSLDERASNRSSNSGSSDNSICLMSNKERLKFGGDVERADSGVGSETSKSRVVSRRDASISESSPTALKGVAQHPCDDCDTLVEYKVANSGLMYWPLVCSRCSVRRQERKEILTETIETEIKYGKDLTVMMEQFCRPMRIAGLLSPDQMDRIFLNIDKLIVHNRQFCLKLRDAYEDALNRGDEDLLTVNVAKLFLHSTPMLHEFQNYCVRQGAASILLQNLEKEKELLRIFLKVSQMENTLLRRMNLHSFLMVPVQRVTKYPLLLARLYKSTPPSHTSREDCRRAREKIELYLQHINNETKDLSPTKLWRKISMSVSNNTPAKWIRNSSENNSTLRLRTVVLDVLEWSTDDACIVREGRLLCLPPESNNWTRRGKTLRFANVKVVLVTLGKPRYHLKEKVKEDGLITLVDLDIKEVALLAFKDHRLTKTALIREPWLLSRSVVTWDDEGESECFEVTDLASKETFIFKDQGSVGTDEWFRSIQFHALSVGSWRRRRPALANIMINGASRN